MTSRHHGARAWRWIGGAALASLLALSAGFVTSSPERISVIPNLTVDALTYDAIGRALSESWSFASIPPLQPPGFVSFLGVIYAIFGHSRIAGRIALWTCLLVATALSAILARRVYRSETSAWTAALLCASCPALVAYAGTLQYEVLTAAMLAGLLVTAATIANDAERPQTGQMMSTAALGFGVGAAVLTRETLVVLVPILAAYLFARTTALRTKRSALQLSGVYLGAALLLPAAWSGLQSERTERTVALSDKGPVVIALGNNPLANGTFNTPLVGEPIAPIGWAFIATRPLDTARLWLRKAGYFWGLLRDGWNVPRYGATFVANAFAGIVPLQWILPWSRGGWLLVVLLVALAGWDRDTWTVWWLAPAAIVGLMALHVVSISSYRFSVPGLPLILAVAAGPVARGAVTVWRAPRLRLGVMTLVLWAIAAQFVSWPLRYTVTADELDGISGANLYDQQMGEVSRVVDAARGRRLAMALVDEYLPSGEMTIRLPVRSEGRNLDPRQPLFRISLATIAGETVCDQIVDGTRVGEQPATLEISCNLPVSGPSTFLVETSGIATLVFGPVHFAWNRR